MNKLILKRVSHPVTMLQIPESALSQRILDNLEGREAYKDADPNNNERIYHGDVFNAILEEMEGLGELTPKNQKLITALEDLAEFVKEDYVQITLA